MPRYEVRLESPDRFQDNGKPHFRVLRFFADDEDAARARAERKEYEHVVFRLPPDWLADLEENGVGHPGDKGALDSHYQERPYQIVSVRRVGPKED